MLVETRLNPSSEVPIIRENDFQRISNNSNYKDYYHIERQKDGTGIATNGQWETENGNGKTEPLTSGKDTFSNFTNIL